MTAETLAEAYWEALQKHLRNDSETSLHSGYELAREALMDGLGVLDMADVHHRALVRILSVHSARRHGIDSAAEFFAECLSPFEMSHRSAQDGTLALRHFNELLEAEHKRIAHALHDEAGQLLATVHLAVADLADELPGHGGSRVQHIHQLLKQIELELRNLSHELRPTVLDNLGLSAALEFLAENVSKRTGLVVTVLGCLEDRLPPDAETALYRIVQEALNNTIKHASAHRVCIELRRSETCVLCSVRDDGNGFLFDVDTTSHGLGLVGIAERLNSLGGSLNIDTQPGRGTLLCAEIPIRGGLEHAVSRVVG